ncbi:MAG: hypothetical protein RIB98_14055 [Acidimicrobiales bacterium]
MPEPTATHTIDDASTRGGPPGFVRVSDDGTRLVFGDLAGNNRLDSYANLVEHPEVGVVAVVVECFIHCAKAVRRAGG